MTIEATKKRSGIYSLMNRLFVRQNGVQDALGSAEHCDAIAPMAEVEGKVAFITGGSSGIGLGIARAFLDAGMKVVISYRTEQHVHEAMKYLANAGERVHAIRADVTDRDGMERAAGEVLSRFGIVHVLVNNAGVVHMVPLSAESYEDWDWVINVNLNGVFNGVRSFLPLIEGHKDGGQIITVSSIAGLIWGTCSYGVTKFAVVGMMEGLRAELAERNIGVSVCCPAGVESRILDSKRNRPPHLVGIGVDDSQALDAFRPEHADPRLSLTALEAGKIVLAGMRNNDLYIMTHPDLEHIIGARNRLLMESIPKRTMDSAHAAYWKQHAMRSVYAKELQRKPRRRRLAWRTIVRHWC